MDINLIVKLLSNCSYDSDKTKMLRTFVDSGQMPELDTSNLSRILNQYSYDSDKTKCIQYLESADRLTLGHDQIIELAKTYSYD